MSAHHQISLESCSTAARRLCLTLAPLATAFLSKDPSREGAMKATEITMTHYHEAHQ